MWVEAILTREDLREFLEQLVPVTFRLGEQGDLCLDAPFVVSLTPEKGISITCHGKLRWPLFGMNVPAVVDPLRDVTAAASVLRAPGAAAAPGNTTRGSRRRGQASPLEGRALRLIERGIANSDQGVSTTRPTTRP
jgi:hypothetical protein